MRRSSGFTLLEVMVAMTITGLALGSLFSVIAGNKRLAWRAQAALLHAIEVRSLVNFAQLNDAQGEVFSESRKDKLQLVLEEKLEVPERKTQATRFDLRGYHIKDEHGDEIASGSYWMWQDLPVAPPGATPAQGVQQGFPGASGSGAGPQGFPQGPGGGRGQPGFPQGPGGGRGPPGFPQGPGGGRGPQGQGRIQFQAGPP